MQTLSKRVWELAATQGPVDITKLDVQFLQKFADILIHDCINTACLAQLEKKNISKEMMDLYFTNVEI